MLNEVYNRRILELAGAIPRLGRLAEPDASATAHSKLCGSTVTVDLKMDGDTVTDFAHEVKACALGQASSSIMASHVVGAKADELRKLRDTVRKMLKENGEPPKDGKWADIAVLEPVRDYKARHASTHADLRRGGGRHRPDRRQADRGSDQGCGGVACSASQNPASTRLASLGAVSSNSIVIRCPGLSVLNVGICRPAPNTPTRRSTVSAFGRAAG